MMTSVPTAACPPAGYSSPSGDAGADVDDDGAALRLANAKRPLPAPAADPCKKRRKQSTPIRISTSGTDGNLDLGLCYEGKPDALSVPAHIKVEHSPSPAEPTSPSLPVNLSGGQNFPPWLSDVQAKTSDWLSASPSASASTLPSFYVPGPVPVSRAGPTSQPPIRIFNPEAYCELCNKEFCNKYFLKTHKANKHRIYTDPPTSDTVSLPVNVPSYTVLKKPCTAPLSDFNKIMLKSADTEAISLSLDAVHKDPEFSDMVATPAPVVATATLSDTDSGMMYKTEHFKEDPALNQLPSMDQDDNSENAQQQRDRENLDFSINRTRRLGIMNPEAFCEICCKEYCNKYFLRTHKMKRHGILIPDENSKDNQKDFKLELSISNNWYQIQTSPLNLIMGEQNTNSSGSCSERKSSPANENECEICGMRFQTLYLAQLHFATVHSQNKPNSNNEDFAAAVSANNNEKQVPDSISEDLQKLQTMILQLNDLDVSKVAVGSSGTTLSTCTCTMCGKEFENRYYLHAHLMTEHGVLLENNAHVADGPDKHFEMDNASEIPSEVQNIDNQSQPKILNSTAMSIPSLDKKDDSNGFMCSEKTMRSAGGTGSGSGSGSGNGNGNTNGTSNSIGSERRSSVTMTPANSYCEICNKELCNKYFMKTHMQRMHGIEIENGAQIGGVVCNICNKELCSKYFLRVHKHNTHGIVQDNVGIGSTQARQPNMDTEQQGATTTDVTAVPDPALKLGDLSDLSNRYFTHFTEVCTICSRRFRSTKWLKAHLLGDHGKAGTEKWNELELLLQQSFGQQQQQQQQTQQHKSASVGDRTSPTLRIPNGGQDKCKSEGGMQNVLSSIFGTDETNVKQYHCSFCSFSTPVLAFLFVHERSHSRGVGVAMGDVPATNNTTASSGNSTAPSAMSPLYCAVCNQSFRQPEQLHHHIVSQHTFLSLSSFFGNVRQVPNDTSTEMPMPNTIVDQVDEHKCSKCRKQLEVSTDVSVTLKDVSKQRQLPATYALPQHQLKAKYMMQAFLMDEPGGDLGATDALSAGGTGTVAFSSQESNGDEDQHQHTSSSAADRRFAPSIVFLPVLEKLTAPLTVSFTLTPA